MTAASDIFTSRTVAGTPTGRSTPLRFVADLRIGAKILILAGVAVVLTALVGLTGQTAVSSVQKTGESIVNDTAEASTLILGTRSDYSAFRRYVYTTAMAQNAEGRDKALENAKGNYDDALAAWKQLGTMPLSASDLDTLNNKLIPAAEQSWQLWEQQLQPTASNLNLNIRQLDAYTAKANAEFDPIADVVRDQIAAIVNNLDQTMSDQVTQSASDAHGAVFRIWAITIVAPWCCSVSACSSPGWCPARSTACGTPWSRWPRVI